MTYETQIEKLKDKESPYVLGSAIALSLFLLTEEEGDIADSFLSLSETDTYLYQAQCGKIRLSKKEWEHYLLQYEESLRNLKFLLLHRFEKGLTLFFEKSLVMLTSLWKEAVLFYQDEFSEIYQNDDSPILMNKRRYCIEWNDDDKNKTSYPLFVILNKLVYRKNQGKKPFCFTGKDSITLKKLNHVVADASSVDLSLIKDISLFASDCISQIKMPSLQNDFHYLSEVFSIFSEEE